MINRLVSRLPRPVRRFGCGALLVLWFTLLTTPCFVIVLAIQGEIALAYSDIPEDQFRIWLVQQIRERGVAISNSRRVDVEGGVCTIIDTRFFLWQGRAEPAHQCSCYSKEEGQTFWRSFAEGDEACQIAEEK
jgi:hypothetical protein